MQLMALTLALVGPYLLLSLAGRLFPAARLAPRARARVGVSLLFLITASGHFTRAQAMSEMLPPWIPARLEIVYVTGVLEIVGAIGIWVPAVARLAGLCLILMLIGMLPANLYAAVHRVPFGGHGSGPLYLWARVPFQLLLIGWVYVATDQRWLRRPRRHALTGGTRRPPLGA